MWPPCTVHSTVQYSAVQYSTAQHLAVGEAGRGLGLAGGGLALHVHPDHVSCLHLGPAGTEAEGGLYHSPVPALEYDQAVEYFPGTKS